MTSDAKAARRLFFALWPDKEVRQDLVASQRSVVPSKAKSTSPANLHLTLGFLGDVARDQASELIAQCGRISIPAFTLSLSTLGIWEKPRILWLAPDPVPDSLMALVASIEEIQRRVHLPVEKRPYQPHVTLARKVETHEVPQPTRVIRWPVADFCLVHSRLSEAGASYRVICRWPLVNG